jgi:hypothetical protein
MSNCALTDSGGRRKEVQDGPPHHAARAFGIAARPPFLSTVLPYFGEFVDVDHSVSARAPGIAPQVHDEVEGRAILHRGQG